MKRFFFEIDSVGMIRHYTTLTSCKRGAKSQIKRFMNNCTRTTADLYELDADGNRHYIGEITEDDIL